MFDPLAGALIGILHLGVLFTTLCHRYQAMSRDILTTRFKYQFCEQDGSTFGLYKIVNFF